jgi:acyl-CoA synthetase (AMP-forming)/AMP-acid ligase II
MTMPGSPVLGEAEDPRGDLAWGTIPRLLEWASASFGDAEAVVDGAVRLTFRQLEVQVDAAARGFIAAGLERGDRVALWAPNCVEWIVGALGALRAGGVIVTLNTRYKGSEASFIINESGARFLLTVRGFLGFDYPSMLEDQAVPTLEATVLLKGSLEGINPQGVVTTSLTSLTEGGAVITNEAMAVRVATIHPDDVSDLVFTSGTTGHPKGVMTSHAQTLRTFATWASIVGLREGDRYLIVNPFFHTFGYKAGLLACLMAGAVAIPEAVFDVDVVLDRIGEEKISMLPGPPTLYQSILQHPRRNEVDLSSLRLGVTGAAVVPVELVIAMRDELNFETVLTAYGLTESCGVVTMCRRNDAPETIATTSGRAIPDLEVRVIGPEGNELSRGEAGEIVARGYPVMLGYFGLDEETAKTIDSDGWLHTGDIGTMDEEGNIVITDRLKDMYVVGGFNAYPAEIEATLRTVAGVGDIAVIGVPDERMGEVGCAIVVRDGDSTAADTIFAEELITWAKEKMANYKVPRRIEFVAELPRNPSGKVLKRALRTQFGSEKI